MSIYNLFRRIAQSDLTPKQIQVNQSKYDISQDFKDSPSYESVLIDNISQDIQIVTDKKDNKKMLSIPDEVFSVGQVVDWNSNKFLITDIDEDQQIQTKGIITLCNNTLTYNKNHISYSLPCIVLSRRDLLDDTKYISVLADETLVKIPNNANSQLIEINDLFTIGQWNYQVIGIDDISELGLLILRLQITQELPETHVYSIEILNGDIQLSTSQTAQLNVVVKDNGEIISHIPPLLFISSNTNVCTVSNTGLITVITTGISIITVNFGTSNASITIISDITIVDNYLLTITPFDTIITINKSKIFTTHFWNNGVEVFNQGCVWSLTNSDGSINVYATITPNGLDCTLTASNNVAYTGKYVKLRSTLVSDDTKFIEREIRLVSLI